MQMNARTWISQWFLAKNYFCFSWIISQELIMASLFVIKAILNHPMYSAQGIFQHHFKCKKVIKWYLIKYSIFSICLAFSSGLGPNFLPFKTKFHKKLQGFCKILWTFTKFFKISQYIITYYLDFIELWCISLTFGFAFGAFESLPQHFSFFQNGSKFQYFSIGDGEGWKSQYRRHLQGKEE